MSKSKQRDINTEKVDMYFVFHVQFSYQPNQPKQILKEIEKERTNEWM